MRVLEGTMKDVIKGLEMTMETREDFGGEWLPTLDVSLAISNRNRLKFKHFEKPTSSNLTMQSRSAMEQNTKMGIMGNEVIRRLLNIGGDIGNSERWEALDGYAVKLLTSGYNLEVTRRVILSGIRGFEAKVKRREQGDIPLYRTAAESGKSRNRKKIIGKSTWFKKSGGGGAKTIAGGNNKKRKINSEDEGGIKTRTVIFVEHTPGGEMAKRMREELSRIEKMMGFRTKVVERSGTKIKDLFSLTNVWGGIPCDRDECITCTQGIEEIPDCTRRSVVYESICRKCVPDVTKPGPVNPLGVDKPCIYVGESSRSIAERAGEHWDAYRARKPDSHIWKHHLVHHEGQGEPDMIFKVVGNYRSALSRQINEAVRIKNRGILALNSKGEYDRCKIHRLTVGEDQKSNWQEAVHQNSDAGKKGEEFIMNKRVTTDRNNRRDAQGNVSVTQPRKRNMKGEEVTRPSKKRKYVLVGPEWGISTKMGNEGLDCLLEEEGGTKNVVASPLNTKNSKKAAGKNIMNKEGTGPLNVNVDTIGNEESNEVTSPLNSSKENNEKVTSNMKPSSEEPSNKSAGPLQEPTGLYEAASNIIVLREARKDCVVKKMYCTVHNQEAKRYTSTKKVWTLIKKTGLYGYRSRKLSVLRCDNSMGTSLGTMGELDGVSEAVESTGGTG